MTARYELPTAVISAAGVNSTVLDLRGVLLHGLVWPSAMTGTNVKMQGSVDGTTFYDVVDFNGTAVSFAVATFAGKMHWIAAETSGGGIALNPAPYIRLVSDGAEASDRTFTAYVREF